MKEVNWSGKKWTKQELIEAVKSFYQAHGRVPRAREFTAKNNYPSRGAFSRQFGSFSNGVRAAGYEPTKPGDYSTRTDEPYWTEEKILNAILAYQDRTGTILTDRKLRYKMIPGLPARNTIRKHFGTILKARAKAQKLKKLTETLKRVQKKIDKLLKGNNE
ncbi:MAG: hypothetical protein EPO24_07725 [Bacteroidetes bacterium]|nr:MAG: hypothetical protein EPO24_07725 [Bacteroidota bacterium]